MVRSLIVTSVLMLVAALSLGQEPFMRNFGVSDGLPSQQVYQVYQDQQGFIWLATDRGISRFDGREFRNYTVDDGLCDNTVFGFYEDHRDRLWMFTFSGKVSWYQQGKFHNPPFNDLLGRDYSHAVIKNMVVDTIGNLWFGCHGPPGIYRMDTLGQASEFFPERGDRNSYLLWEEQFTPQGLAGVYGIGEGFKMVPPERNLDPETIETLRLRTDSNDMLTMPSVLDLPNNCTAVTLPDHLSIRKDGLEIQSIPFPGNIISRIIRDREGNLWVGTLREGVVRLSLNPSGQYEISGHFLRGHSVSAILQDREGAFWFSTLFNGLFCAPELNTRSYFLEEFRFGAIHVIGQEVYAGAVEEKLIRISDEGTQIIPLTEGNHLGEVFLVTNTPEGNLIFGNGWKTYVREGNSGPFKIFWDRPGRHYLPTENGHWISAINYFSYFEQGEEVFSSVSLGLRLRILSIANQGSRSLLLGSMSGLYQFDQKDFRQVEGHPWLREAINKLAWLPSGELVIGTKSLGLLIRHGDEFQALDKQSGLISNNCHDLLVDASGTIWVASDQGVQEIRLSGAFPFEWETITYSDEDGLCSRQVNRIALQDSLIWAATSKGISAMQRKSNPGLPSFPVLLDRFEVNGRDSLFSTAMALQPGDNNLAFHFVALTFKSLRRPEFLYRLSGLHDHWISTTDPLIRFHALQPANYTLQVRVRGADDTIPMQEFSFSVLAPWWQRTWVRILAGLLILSLISAAVTWQFQQRIKRSRLQRLSMQSELKALRAQMNPHFLFNSLNSIQHLISQEKKDKAIMAVADFAVLVRKILNNSNRSELTLAEEQETLTLYLEMETRRFGDRLHYALEIDPQLDPTKTFLPSMLLQPFVENAIWHGLMKKEPPGGQVLIRIGREDNNLVCTILDDGIGRDAARRINEQLPGKPPSTGLHMMRARIRVLNISRKEPITLSIRDGKSPEGRTLGTIVTLMIPPE